MPSSCTTYTGSGHVVNLTYNLPAPPTSSIETNPAAPNFLFSPRPTGNGRPPPPISLASLNPLPPHSTAIDANKSTIFDYIQHPGQASVMAQVRFLKILIFDFSMLHIILHR